MVLFNEQFWQKEEETMFTFVHHVHYVVEDLEKVISYMENNFEMVPDHKGENTERAYKEAVYKVGPTLIEFTQPTKPDTSMAKFLQKKGPGVYHVAWGTDLLEEKAKRLASKGVKLRDSGIGKSPRGYKTLNFDPSDSIGTLFQLAQG
jgi:methylmalonyl-CoA/ethylmalonyl-CoA epimerase